MDKEIETCFIDGSNGDILEEIRGYNNIKELIIKGVTLDNRGLDCILELNRLEEITFIDCNIITDRIGELKVRSLHLLDSYLEDISDINKIKELDTLFLEGMELIDLKNLAVIRKIKNLSLFNSNVINEEQLIYLSKIQKLRIDNTGIEDLSLCLVMKGLKQLVVDQNQVLNNRDLLLKLKDNNIEVVDYMNQGVV